MIVIKFSIYNQRLRRITSGIIPSNAYGKLKFEFDFRTDDWNAVETKTANFYYRGDNYHVELDENNQCFVPKEVINSPSFNVAVHGGDIVTNYVRNPVEYVKSSSPTIPDISDDELNSDGINIFDGGEVILDLTDGSIDDDETDSSDEKGVIDYITANSVPFYIGIVEAESSKVEYLQLDASTANYTDQGFYIAKNNKGDITNAGYQITFEGNDENIAQTFSIYSTAKIVTAYQYHIAFDQWLDVGFDGTYWVEDGTTTKIINGKQVAYTTYAYNVELMGDAIMVPEYWRFEVEVS